METYRGTKNGSQRQTCFCILTNMDDDDDVVMHDVDCSYCDGEGFSETTFLVDNKCDSGSFLRFDDVECTAEEGGVIKLRTQEKRTKSEVFDNKEAQLDKHIAELHDNNIRLLQRFYEVQEDKMQAKWRNEVWKRENAVAVSLRVSVSPLSGYRSVTLVEKKKKRKNRRKVVMQL